MKRSTIIFIVLYLVLFSLIGVWLYRKYFPQRSSLDNQAQTINLGENKTILYTINNDLYQLNTDNLNRNSASTGTSHLQSSGQIQTVALDPKNEFFVYDSITADKTSEIWQVSLKDNHLEKLFTAATPGFEAYKNFRSPKMSKIDRKLAFIASSQGVDDIYVWDIENNTTSNLTLKSIPGKITAFDWAETESKIYFTTQDNNKTSFKLIDLNKKSSNLFEGANQITKMEVLSDRIIVRFLDSDATANLGYLMLDKPEKIVPITDLKAPSTIINFDLSPDSQQIVYQAQNTNLKTNDLYIINVDGTNLLQLSTDGQSQSPIFSPDTKKIAFYVKGSGIYTMNSSKNNKTKILNEEKTINNLILWR